MRKIAEFVLYLRDIPIDRVDLIKARDMLAALLDALVKERAKLLFALHLSSSTIRWYEIGDEIDLLTGKRNTLFTKLYWLEKALHELNLKDVWPRKGGK